MRQPLDNKTGTPPPDGDLRLHGAFALAEDAPDRPRGRDFRALHLGRYRAGCTLVWEARCHSNLGGVVR